MFEINLSTKLQNDQPIKLEVLFNDFDIKTLFGKYDSINNGIQSFTGNFHSTLNLFCLELYDIIYDTYENSRITELKLQTIVVTVQCRNGAWISLDKLPDLSEEEKEINFVLQKKRKRFEISEVDDIQEYVTSQFVQSESESQQNRTTNNHKKSKNICLNVLIILTAFLVPSIYLIMYSNLLYDHPINKWYIDNLYHFIG